MTGEETQYESDEWRLRFMSIGPPGQVLLMPTCVYNRHPTSSIDWPRILALLDIGSHDG